MTALGLTPRARELLRFIEEHFDRHGVAPTFAEMCTGIGVSSKHAVFRLLAQLEERGHIRRLPNRARAIELLRPRPNRRAVLVNLGTDYERVAAAARHLGCSVEEFLLAAGRVGAEQALRLNLHPEAAA